MVNEWMFIGMFLLMGAIFPGAPILINSLILGPKKNNPVKNSAYECGIETVGDTWVQFKVQYYIFALVFVVFDVETIFLFPFAVAYNQVRLLRRDWRSCFLSSFWPAACSTPGARARWSGPESQAFPIAYRNSR